MQFGRCSGFSGSGGVVGICVSCICVSHMFLCFGMFVYMYLFYISVYYFLFVVCNLVAAICYSVLLRCYEFVSMGVSFRAFLCFAACGSYLYFCAFWYFSPAYTPFLSW